MKRFVKTLLMIILFLAAVSAQTVSVNAEDSNNSLAASTKNIYPEKTLNEKRELIRFMESFAGHQSFDISNYKDRDLLVWVNKNTFHGVAPFKYDYYTNEKNLKVDNGNGQMVEWSYEIFPYNEVNKYILNSFGVIPSLKEKYPGDWESFPYFYMNGNYYFPAFEMGSAQFDYSPQIEEMYSLGNSYYYLAFTNYEIYSEWDDKAEEWIPDVDKYKPISNWSKEEKSKANASEHGYAIIKDAVIDGKKTWNIIRYEIGTTLPKDNLTIYTDVSKQYNEAVTYLFQHGIANGTSTTVFGTYENIKRVDATVLIAKALQLDMQNGKNSGFTDVPERAKEAVNVLVEKKIINGKAPNRLGSQDPLTRGEMALILTKAYGLDNTGSNSALGFTDVAPLYKDAVKALVKNGITKGKSVDKFGTNEPITRGEMAIFLYRASKLSE